MKGIQLLVFLVLALAVIVSGFPREREVESVEDNTEYVPVPVVPAVAVPAGPTFGYIPSFYSFLPNFDLMSRIRGLMTRLGAQVGDPFGNIDWSKGNTTSSTKIIDGHVVTVNETSFKDDDTDLVLHVKVIDVKPSEGPEGSSEVAIPTENNSENDVPPSAISSEDIEGNEIPNKPGEAVAESLDYRYQPKEEREHLIETREYLSPDYLHDIDGPVEEVDNTIEEINPVSFQPIPLHNDILVNKIEEDKGEMIMLPNDVEYFVPDNRDMYTINENNEFVYNPTNMPIYGIVPYARFQHRPRSEKLTRLT